MEKHTPLDGIIPTIRAKRDVIAKEIDKINKELNDLYDKDMSDESSEDINPETQKARDELIKKVDDLKSQDTELLRKEMANMTKVDELLDRAKELLPNADPFLEEFPDPHMKHTDDSLNFISEARKRLEKMENGKEKENLQEKLNDIYSKYLDIANSDPRFKM